jgi:glycosyltransferase involved in cell wall biosynthesis
MKLSVMITCYNCEDYIGQTIESVIKQEKPFEWELLIGDDGSDDSTVDIIKDWIDKYPDNIKLFIMERTKTSKKDGTRAAKNRANLLRHANGEYLAFLDGDDQLLGTDKFIQQVKILDSKEYQACSGCAHNIKVVDTSNTQNTKIYNMIPKGQYNGIIDNQKYWKLMYFHTNTLVFREECKQLLLDEKYCDFLNDNFITYIVLQYGSLYYLDDVYAQYNVTGQGLWTGKKRVYGCFRNMILYDLELDINKKYKPSAFYRHLYDFVIIFRQYKGPEFDIIAPLFDNLKPDLFHYTYLMAKKGPYGMSQKIERFFLRVEVSIRHALGLINAIRNKAKRSILSK